MISFWIELISNLHMLVAEIFLPQMMVCLRHGVIDKGQFGVNLVEMYQLVERFLIVAEIIIHVRFHEERVRLCWIKLQRLETKLLHEARICQLWYFIEALESFIQFSFLVANLPHVRPNSSVLWIVSQR